ncbi:hypothetical protein HDV63DRAFT_148976 [Trichoderma sp. SZMC 28014]
MDFVKQLTDSRKNSKANARENLSEQQSGSGGLSIVKKLTGSGKNSEANARENLSEQQSGSGGLSIVKKLTGGGLMDKMNNKAGGGLKDKMNNMAGGGAQGEKDEDLLDKAVDFVQQRFLGQGDQSNESAAEQQKDEVISDTIRDIFKKATGRDFPIKDKEKRFGV